MTSHGSPKIAKKFDLLIVGAGLSGGLIAACLKHRRPDWRVAIAEKSQVAGGNHTWSFHGSDIPAVSWAWLSRFVSKSWASHSVHFPDLERKFDSPYHAIRSEDFHRHLQVLLGENLLLSAEAQEIGPDSARLTGGETLKANAVIDARGFSSVPGFRAGFQKFLGLDLRLTAAHGLTSPVLMDARVAQQDGYRFFYLLPWDENTLLVEDTRYSDSPVLEEDDLKSAIFAYCLRRGWAIESIDRSEKGVLPIPLEMPPRPQKSVGARSGSFQDTTGFSLPDAVRTAEAIAEIATLSPASVEECLRKYERSRYRQRTFFRALNRMLFLAASPTDRYLVLQKFYRLPSPIIQRFYAGRINWRDAARILSGSPPVPLWKGLTSAISVKWGPSG